MLMEDVTITHVSSKNSPNEKYYPLLLFNPCDMIRFINGRCSNVFSKELRAPVLNHFHQRSMIKSNESETQQIKKQYKLCGTGLLSVERLMLSLICQSMFDLRV
uniref:Ovule protein n=1 Tax=Heterorhabditis bacteriophora TaxID=37862 RepID=A0A1I7WB93_HETBA